MRKGIPHRAAVRSAFYPSIVEARKKEYAGCLRLVAGNWGMPAKSACTEWSMLTKTSWYSSWLAAAPAAAVSLYQGRGTVHLIKVLDFLGNRDLPGIVATRPSQNAPESLRPY